MYIEHSIYISIYLYRGIERVYIERVYIYLYKESKYKEYKEGERVRLIKR